MISAHFQNNMEAQTRRLRQRGGDVSARFSEQTNKLINISPTKIELSLYLFASNQNQHSSENFKPKTQIQHSLKVLNAKGSYTESIDGKEKEAKFGITTNSGMELKSTYKVKTNLVSVSTKE